MKISQISLDREVRREVISDEKEAWTLSDLIKFLQEVEKLGYSDYYIAGHDLEYGIQWMTRHPTIAAVQLDDEGIENASDFNTRLAKVSELLRSNNGKYCIISF